MMVMWEKEKVNEKDLVNALYLKANTLTDLLRKLKKKGYIEISRDETDRRNIVISLTDEGRQLKKKLSKCQKRLPMSTGLLTKNSILSKNYFINF